MWWACIYVILSVTFLNGWDITYTFFISDDVRPNGFQNLMSDFVLIIVNGSQILLTYIFYGYFARVANRHANNIENM